MGALPWKGASDDSVGRPAIELSVVCPFFDEEGVVGEGVSTLLSHLTSRSMRFEIILVDDGSTDDGRAEALLAAGGDPRVRVIGYDRNRGRGHALRTGIEAARGALVCTMEADLAYGVDVIDRMVAVLRRERDVDVVIVSPDLPGGGYEGVPLLRVLATRWGNRLLRWTMSSGLATHTGMTRCYRRAAIRGLPLHEDGKEFHLEVLSKALALGLVVVETPGTLRWPASRRARARIGGQVAVTRRTAGSHLRWVLLANPTRVLLNAGGFTLAAGATVAAARLVRGVAAGVEEEVALALAARACLLGVILLALGLVTAQTRRMLVEIWRFERDRALERMDEEAPPPRSAAASRPVRRSPAGRAGAA